LKLAPKCNQLLNKNIIFQNELAHANNARFEIHLELIKTFLAKLEKSEQSFEFSKVIIVNKFLDATTFF
jgi:hypothetical protein